MIDGVTWSGGPPLIVNALEAAIDWTTDAAGETIEPVAEVFVVVHLGPGLPPEVAAVVDSQEAGDNGIVWVAGELTGYQIAAALSHGCMSVVMHDHPLSDLRTAITEARQGRSWLPPSVVMAVSAAIRRPQAAPEKKLTAREVEVLELLRLGRTTQEIAEELVVSTHTASNHVRHIMTKLEVHSRLKAVAVAYELGIVDTH